MRTSLGALFSALLGYFAALLSVAARIGQISLGQGAATSPDRDQPQDPGWSDALISDAPTSQRLLLSRDGVDDRDGLASAWRANGRRAQAAIAASSQRSLDLVMLDAPPSLIGAANEDALGEIRHAKICFALARAIDAREASSLSNGCTGVPRRALPRARVAALATLAATHLESALTEGLSARMNAKLARRAIDKSIRAALEEIASVEAQHAAHAWAVIEWCLAEGGSVVEHALRAAASPTKTMLARTTSRDIPLVAREGGWERWGIAGAALEQQEIEGATRAIDRGVTELARGTTRSRRLVAA